MSRHVWIGPAGEDWTPDAASDYCFECRGTPDSHPPRGKNGLCAKDLGQRLTPRTLRWVPYLCSKPATVEGPDGAYRCPQHDRMARGLSGKWAST